MQDSVCLSFRDFLLCWRHIYESFLSIQCNWASKKLQTTASKGFIFWSDDIIFRIISLRHIALYCLLWPYPWSLSILLKCHGFSLMSTCKSSLNKTSVSTWTCTQIKALLKKRGVFLFIWLALDQAFSIVKSCEMFHLKKCFENMLDTVNKHTGNAINKNWLV